MENKKIGCLNTNRLLVPINQLPTHATRIDQSIAYICYKNVLVAYNNYGKFLTSFNEDPRDERILVFACLVYTWKTAIDHYYRPLLLRLIIFAWM